jgi:PBS lyase HEAT-like repeat
MKKFFRNGAIELRPTSFLPAGKQPTRDFKLLPPDSALTPRKPRRPLPWFWEKETTIPFRAWAAVLQGKDRHLRRLAVNALQMMGPSAQKAMPALIEQLYHGPVRERHNVADALAAVGDSAIEPLREASSHDDPWIRCPADYSLGKLGITCGSPQSLIRQFQKRFLTRERFFYLFLQHVNRENVADVLAALPPSYLEIIKTEVENPPPGRWGSAGS